MGACWTKLGKKAALREDKMSLATILETFPPEELVDLVLESPEVYKVCKEYADLRRAFILGAVRRYHVEKMFLEEVYQRTARYMVILDEFLDIHEAIKREETGGCVKSENGNQ